MRALAWTAGLVVALALVAGANVAERHFESSQIAITSAHPLAVSGVDFMNYPSNALAPTQTPAASSPSTVAPPKPKASAPSRPPESPRIVVVTTQQALINRDRASYGLAPLTWSPCLYNVALSNAGRMGSQEHISHTNGVYSDLACGLGHRSGENVGFWSAGINDVAINNLFMASPTTKQTFSAPTTTSLAGVDARTAAITSSGVPGVMIGSSSLSGLAWQHRTRPSGLNSILRDGSRLLRKSP